MSEALHAPAEAGAENVPHDARGRPLPYVETTLTHLLPTGEKPVIMIGRPGEADGRRADNYAPYRVRIHDARPIADQLDLDEQGFVVIPRPSAVGDFYNEDEIRDVYYPEVITLLKEVAGASEVVVFDHTTRRDGDPAERRDGVRGPVRNAHNDYTEKSGPQRVRDLLPADEAARWLAGRFAVINVWRPINGPVETMPLAVADARSMAPGDLVAADLVYEDRTGEVYDVVHSEGQRWFYVPHMTSDEVVLLKCYDSATDGRARFTAHTAFDDPTTPADARPRESIEVRTLVLFED